MEKKEFNLSVLEYATTFSSPLKDFANYETILSLIKEEIDTSTEDETVTSGYHWRPDKPRNKSPYLRAGKKRKKSEPHDSEGAVFKSPYKKRCYSLNKLTASSPVNLPNNGKFDNDKSDNIKNGNGQLKRATSLGTVKPGRSFLANCGTRSGDHKNRRKSFVSHLSENTLILSDFEHHSMIAKIILENGNKHAEYNVNDDMLEIVKNARETCQREKVGSIEGTASDDDDDFVESSQTTECSDLRRRLLDRKSTIEYNNKYKATIERMESNLQMNFRQSEEEEESTNFHLKLSPSSKSVASTRETSPMPQSSLRKKKIRPLGMSSPKERKFNGLCETIATTSPQTSLKSRLSSESPLKGFTQELENCIMNSDYEQMTEDIETDMLERTSFTFETIELLNEYDHGDPSRTNNQILSKIFSSPVQEIKKESHESLESVTVQVQTSEDPLYIKENYEANDTVAAPLAITENTEQQTVKTRKTKGHILRRKSCLQETTTESNVVPSTMSEETKEGIVVSRCKSRLIETTEAKKSMDKAAMRKNGTSAAVKKSKANKQCFSGGGLRRREDEEMKKKKKAINISLSEFEDDENLALEAAKLSKKVKAAERKAALSEEILQKLDNLVIHLRHKVLPQHEIETRAGSTSLSYKQQKKFIKLAPLNKDTYSPAEDNVIQQNWKAFCEDHDWDPKDYKPFLHLKHGQNLIMSSLEERRKFVQFLANGLPNRPLYSVYSRFKILYNKYTSAGSRYTHKEDIKILAHMLHNPSENPDKKCSELAIILDRSRVSIWKRYKKLMEKFHPRGEKEVLTKVEWNLPLTQSFITVLLDVTLSEELIELKDAFIPKVVWLKMQEKMKIKHELMKRFWEQQLHLQLFSPVPLYINEIKIALIEHMYEKKIGHSMEIKWNDVARHFDGLTVPFLRKVFNHLTAKASATLGSRNLIKIMRWLYKREMGQLKNEPKDRCLPRISYENEKAQIVPEDLEQIKKTTLTDLDGD